MITAADISLPDVGDIMPAHYLDVKGFFGHHTAMEPDTEELMLEYNEREWRGQNIARGEHWSTSFHASSFPGDDKYACERYLIYQMMDVPDREPMPPWVTTTGDVGKAVELSIARAWFDGGRALAIPEDHPRYPDAGQLVFANPDLWTTGSVDLPILKKGWHRPHIVEIKAKADDVLEEMLNGVFNHQSGKKEYRRWDVGHRRQLLAALGLSHGYDWGYVTVCHESWRILDADTLASQGFHDNIQVEINMDTAQLDRIVSCPEHGTDCLYRFKLEPPVTGEIYYASRSWPRKTKQFFFRHDPSFMREGYSVIRRARDAYAADELPVRNPVFMWSMGACNYCPHKAETCKPDEGFVGRKRPNKPVTKISESHGHEHAESVRGQHDPEEVWTRVIDRWS